MTTTTATVHRLKYRLRNRLEAVCGASSGESITEGEITADLVRVNCPRCVPSVALELAEMLGAHLEEEVTSEDRDRLFGYSGGPFAEEGPSIFKSKEDAGLGFLRRLYGGLGVFLRQAPDDRDLLLAQLEELKRDAMTRLFRREVGEYMLERLPRKRFALAILIDLDGLKALNTRGGHAEGDQAIRQLATAIGGALRAGDVGVRWGGDEFVLGLPIGETCDPDALGESVVERIREQLRLSNDRLSFTAAWAVYTHTGTPYGQGIAAAVQMTSESVIAQKAAARELAGRRVMTTKWNP